MIFAISERSAPKAQIRPVNRIVIALTWKRINYFIYDCYLISCLSFLRNWSCCSLFICLNLGWIWFNSIVTGSSVLVSLIVFWMFSHNVSHSCLTRFNFRLFSVGITSGCSLMVREWYLKRVKQWKNFGAEGYWGSFDLKETLVE